MPAIPPVPYTEQPRMGLDPVRFEALWTYRAVQPMAQRVLPDGRTDVVVHLRTLDGERTALAPRLAIAGPTEKPRDTAVGAGLVSIGLRLRPAWTAACLGVDAPSLRDRVLLDDDARAVLGDLAALVSTPRSVPEAIEAVRSLAAALARRASAGAHQSARQTRADQALRLLEDGTGRPPAAVAAALGVGERTLRRDVLATAGLPMRTLSGLARLRRALTLMRDGQSSLSDIAFASGYSDQAHMNREFRRFGGFTPARPAGVPLIGTGR